jgi:hypothetical protein
MLLIVLSIKAGKVMVTRSFIFMLMYFFTMTFSLFSKIHYTGREKVVFISTIETRNCFVSYVMIDGVTYLVKQKKDWKKQLAVVRDALAAWIAKGFAIAHQVDVISSKSDFPGKVRPSWPATLHTIAPGKTVREQRDSKYNALRLRQLWAKANTFNEKGLTKDIITYMTWHRQLPVIIALDLMIGNSDRHCGNLCYDPNADKFCAIDMDDTFNKDLCLLAYEKLKFMIEQEGISFTKNEIIALISMRDTLKFLVRRYKPHDVIEKLYFFAQKAGFTRGSDLYNDKVKKKLLFYETMITSSYLNARKLISLLDKIIARKYSFVV